MAVILGQINKMKSPRQKRKSPKEQPANVLQEPAVAYGIAQSRQVRNSLSLMGLADIAAYKTIQSTTDFIERIREGLPKKALDHLSEIAGLTDIEMAGIIHTSDRTLRRYAASQKLNAEQSERIIELARLYTRGADVFDDIESFKIWMATPVDALGGKKPKVFLDTSMGIELLMEELGRIEQGIFA
ncbi:type II RES/Xre toxin-antitoxin system antitoxin [Niabella soli]|uniref:Uncharacterized protein n=1 Tax=Niabella soli DSM 19437 TaxID=929713 RepID=W0F467_9BACT|nr:antitoxin Xre-like helix-turn-helix domain-containing protein [Niabella soli]AHF16608.1 hypothetical protein NIASO_18380 [Niabella soli DSM 19437]